MTKVVIPITTPGAGKAQKQIDKTGNSLGSLAKKAGLAAGAYFGATALLGGIKESIRLFGAQQEAEKKLEAVLKSTGHAAGMTAGELRNMASALQQQTKFGDEAIMGAQSLMLTFTKVGKDVMPNAIETVLNMSEAMGTGLKESTIQLGKALNDPVLGISALSRVGVQLSETQKQQIKDFTAVGDIASAQKVILGELETQFGGMAKAAGQTFAGSMAQMSNAIGDAGEAFGSLLAPALQKAAGWVKGLAEGFSNAVTFIQSIDWAGTVNNILNNLSALGSVFIKILGVYWDLLPDILKSALMKAWDLLKTQLGFALEMFKSLASFVWEPLKIATQMLAVWIGMKMESMWIGIQNTWTSGINGLKELYNSIAEFIGAEPLEMTPLIDSEAALSNNQEMMDGLKSQMEETGAAQMMKNLFRVGEDDVQTFADASEAIGDILGEFWDGVAVKKEEVGDPHSLLTEEDVETENKNMEKRAKNKDKIDKKDQKRESKYTEHFKKMKNAQMAKLKSTEEGQKIQKIKSAVADAYANATKSYKALADIPVVGPMLGFAAAAAAFAFSMSQIGGIKSAAKGADFTTSGPELMLVGDNPSGREHVQVTPLGVNGGSSSSASVTVNVSGNVMSDDFVQDTLIEQIREGIRLGESID